MAYDFSTISCLVVDDNPHMRKLVVALLYTLGIKHVFEADDGGEAFKMIKARTPDIIICDWIMAPVDGIELVKRVRTAHDSPNPYIPIILLTGHTEKHRITEARDAGINEFLAKPISAKRLYQRIINVIEKPRTFVKTDTYFGPDRRRHRKSTYKGPERRVALKQKHTNALSPDEVAALLKE